MIASFLTPDVPTFASNETALPIEIDVLDSHSIPATGRGEVDVRLLVHDALGGAVCGARVHVTIERGDAAFAGGARDIDLACTHDGHVVVPIVPGTLAGELRLLVTVAPDRSLVVPLRLTAVDAQPMVIGFATLGVGAVPGPVEAPDNGPNGEMTRRAGAGLYASGPLSGITRLTVAYNSAATLQSQISSGPFTDNPADRPFAIYGDASTRYDDALSRYRVYARIDAGASSALLGQFQAVATPVEVAGGYSILLNGVHLQFQNKALGATAFTARNDVAYNRQVISPTGLSVSSQALQPDIVVGSDVLTLVHLDRRTGAVVAQTVLVRGVDYQIDYASGLLRFLNVLLPFDDQLDPQIVVAQYEYGGSAAHSTVFGASGAAKFGRDGSTRFDSWYLNDAVGTGNVSILGEAFSGKLPGGGWSVSHEHSNGLLPVTQTQAGGLGDAYLGTLTFASSRFSADVRTTITSAGYANPFGAYATPGLLSISARLSERISRIASLELTHLTAANDLPAGTTSTAVTNRDTETALRVNVRPSRRLSYHVGIKTESATGNGTNGLFALPGANNGITGFTNSLLTPPAFATATATAGVGSSLAAEYGATWQFAPHASIGASRSDRLGAGTDPYDPPQTLAQLTIDIAPHTQGFVRQLWQTANVQPLAATQGQQTYPATATSTTSIGIAQQIGNASIEYGYAVDHTASATDLYNAIGVRETFLASSRFGGDAFVQAGRSLLATYAAGTGPGTPSFIVAGTSLSYALPTFHASGQVQVRTGYDAGSTFQLGAAGTVSPDVSLFGSLLGAYTSGVTDADLRAGISYRPGKNDRYVTLATVDVNKTNLTNYDGYVTNVAQLQELYRPSSRTELAASVAYKITGDATFLPRTTIYGIRADQRIGARFDLATELHQSSTAPLGDTRATGLVVEGGWRLGDAVRLAAGYNFSGYIDPATAVNPTHRGVYLTMSSYIDRIFGWGKEARP